MFITATGGVRIIVDFRYILIGVFLRDMTLNLLSVSAMERGLCLSDVFYA